MSPTVIVIEIIMRGSSFSFRFLYRFLVEAKQKLKVLGPVYMRPSRTGTIIIYNKCLHETGTKNC